MTFLRPQYYINYFNTILKFSINPKSNSLLDLKLSRKLMNLMPILVVMMITIFMANSLIVLLNVPMHIYISKNVILNNIFYIFLLSPFLEELAFRLGLSLKKYHLLISTLFFIYILNKVIAKIDIDKLTLNAITAISTLISIILIYKFYNKIAPILKNHYRYIYYSSAIIFGSLHLSNNMQILKDTKLIIYLPVIVLPYIVSGFFLQYIRINYGFLYGFLLHVMNNGVMLLIAILFAKS